MRKNGTSGSVLALLIAVLVPLASGCTTSVKPDPTQVQSTPPRVSAPSIRVPEYIVECLKKAGELPIRGGGVIICDPDDDDKQRTR